MWCLETIVALNDKLAGGKTLGEAFKECGIKLPGEKPAKKASPEGDSWDMPPPSVRVAS